MATKYLDADSRVLRGIAHPVRSALLYELYARGRANATTLAEAVAQPVNSVSFHLRQLGRYGLIEDASGVSDGRERWWQPSASEGLRIEKAHLSATPQGEVALRAFRRHAAAYWQALVERFFAADHGQGVWESHDVPMLLTDQEARRCAGEVFEVLSKWNRRGQRSDPREDPPRRTYIGMALVMPHQTDLVERSSGRSPRSRSAALGPLDERGQQPPVDGWRLR